ncbi:MAG TPA: hypothetical protein VI488_03000 [Candidatus Angelobacter sp.]
MDLTARKGKLSIFWLLLCASSLILAATALAQPAPPAPSPCVNQSPRKLHFDPVRLDPPAQGEDYNFVSKTPLVTVASADKIMYQARELELCDRHYHVPVENIQGCPNEKVDKRQGGSGPPPVGQWVEVHNVYAAEVNRSGECASGHDHELQCCAKPPFVVVGYSAQIADKDTPPGFTDFAEWAGSATKEDPVTGCNTTPGQWHFGLGCQTQLTPLSLERNVGGKPHVARTLQGPNRVSSDLTFVDANSLDAVCRKVRTDLIQTDALAQRICPGVCRWPLNRFTGQWNNISPDGPDHPATGYAVCTCCPLQRPQ